MKTRLWRHDLTIQRAYGASDTRLVPAGGAVVEVYRQGATVSANTSLTGASDTVPVYDTGGIKVGDVLQIGTAASPTLTVDAVGAAQLTVSGYPDPTSVSLGDRLVVRSVRPSVFQDPTGLVQVDPTNQGRGGTAGATTGAVGFYTPMPTVDVLVSGGGLTAAQMQVDLSGQMESRVVRIEDFGGYEASVVQGASELTDFNNSPVLTAALAYLQALGGGTLVFGPGTYKFNSAVSLASLTNPVTLKGAGIRETVLQRVGASGSLFTFPNTSGNVTLEDCTSSRDSGTDAVLTINTNNQNTILRRVRCSGVGSGVRDDGTGTQLLDCEWDGDATLAYYKTTGNNCTIRHPKFRCTAGAIGTNGLMTIDGGENLVVDDFDSLWGPTDNGTVLKISGACRKVTFNGGVFTGGNSGAGKNAIEISNGRGVRFIVPIVHKSAKGVLISGGAGVQLVVPVVVDCIAEGIDVTVTSGYPDIIFPLVSECNTGNTVGKNLIEIAGTVNDVRVIGPRTGALNIGTGTTGASTDFGVNVADGTGLRAMVALAAGVAGTLGIWRVAKAGATNDRFHTYGLNQPLAGGSVMWSGVAFHPRALAPAATPTEDLDVNGVSYVTLTPAGSCTVTSMSGGIPGQIVTVENLHATNTVTINDGGNFDTVGGAAIVLNQYEQAMFQRNSNNVWRHIAMGQY